jgi:putative flippase GtrA
MVLTVDTSTHTEVRSNGTREDPASTKAVSSLVLHLLSPDSGTVGQGVRFVLVGGTVFVTYLTVTTVLADVFHVAFELALVVGFVTALCMHFTLQRWFVWVHDAEFALGFGRQVGRYLLLASAQYLITATTTSVLPGVLGIQVTFVYFATAIALTVFNFLVLRNKIFYAR